ncbi:MAG TPA: DUF169 domain-containing protein [Paludibacter sp.]|nr:DUF169 domain-containing protein [Paludibacter sp.]
MKQPDFSYLIEKTGITFPLIGFYDVPDASLFEPFVESKACIFAYFKKWEKGVSLLLTKEQFGCGGAGSWLCDVRIRTKEQYVKFLADDEGLKANHELMGLWLDNLRPYKQQHPNLVIGPLKAAGYEYLKTITFFVTPDQLSMLMIGAQLNSAPSDPDPVIAPFGSGCMQLISHFKDLNIPQAMIGALDMAMRKYLPPNILAFTVTRPMFEQLCNIDKNSYMEKRFFTESQKSRKEKE